MGRAGRVPPGQNGHERHTAVFAGVERAHEIAVCQPGQQPGLGVEAGGVGGADTERLHGHVPIEAEVAGEEDIGRRPLAIDASIL